MPKRLGRYTCINEGKLSEKEIVDILDEFIDKETMTTIQPEELYFPFRRKKPKHNRPKQTAEDLEFLKKHFDSNDESDK